MNSSITRILDEKNVSKEVEPFTVEVRRSKSPMCENQPDLMREREYECGHDRRLDNREGSLIWDLNCERMVEVTKVAPGPVLVERTSSVIGGLA